jgi:hypothetical protein
MIGAIAERDRDLPSLLDPTAEEQAGTALRLEHHLCIGERIPVLTSTP